MNNKDKNTNFKDVKNKEYFFFKPGECIVCLHVRFYRTGGFIETQLQPKPMGTFY